MDSQVHGGSRGMRGEILQGPLRCGIASENFGQPAVPGVAICLFVWQYIAASCDS